MTARSKAYTRIGCLPDCWSDRTLRPVRRSEAPIGCTGGVRVLSAGLRPGDFELLAAPPAGHAARPSRQRLPLPAARANGVALAPARGETHGVVGPGDHAPPAGRPLDDLQERGWNLEQAATDLENGPKRIEPRDTVPRPAAKLHVQVGLQASPHPSHRGSLVIYRTPLFCIDDALRQAPPRGSQSRCNLRPCLCVLPVEARGTPSHASPPRIRPYESPAGQAPEVDPWFSRQRDGSASVSRRS